MKKHFIFSCFFLLFISCQNKSGQNVPIEIQKENNFISINPEWIDWAVCVKDTDSGKQQISSAVTEVFAALSKNISPDQFDLKAYIDTSFHSEAFIEGYKENLDTDPEKECILMVGGLSDQSLLLVIDSTNGKFQIIYHSSENSHNDRPIIKFYNNGGYKLFELITKGGGTTDCRTDAHNLYKLVDSKIHKVFEAHEGIDLSGTLKVKTNFTMQMWDTTQKEDAVLLHYKAKYWLCSNYDVKNSGTETQNNWDLYRSGSCDPSDGVLLLNDEYGLLCRWSADSLKYLPDYSRGMNAGQRDILENINSDEEYAKKFFNFFKKDIYNQSEARNSTINWLKERFDKGDTAQ